MGKITFFEQDYKIETKEGKIYQIEKKTFNKFKIFKDINLKFTNEDIYNNVFLDQMNEYYNNPFYLKYLDSTYKINKDIRFDYYTYIGDNPTLIDKNLIDNLIKTGIGYQTYKIALYLYDPETNFYYSIGVVNLSITKHSPGFLFSGYNELILDGNIYLNTDDFIVELSKRYFGTGNGNEEFDIQK